METKKCSRCNNIFNIENFNISRKSDHKVYYRTYCKSCQKNYHNSYYKNNADKYISYRKENIEAINQYKNKLNQRNINFVKKYKQDKVCKDCDKNYPYYVMDFDHLHSKKEKISHLVYGSSIKSLLEEISKCELVCSNCHRIRTQSRKIFKNTIQNDKINIIKNYIQKCKSNACIDCHNSYPYYVMDFDHKNNTEKIGNISEMVYSFSFKKIAEEIEKCDVICSNCHRIRTFKFNKMG